MQPPSVVIAANPYEAELCRRALVDIGLQVLVADGGEGALELVREAHPLVLVVALGLLDVDSLDLVRDVRIRDSKLPIFLLGDREGEVRDEDAAARLGATRLFLRPIEIDALADAIEKRAVEAEIHDEVSEAIEEFSVRPPTIDAAPLVEESIVELEADYGDDEPDEPQRRVPREPTQVLGRDGAPLSSGYSSDARPAYEELRVSGARATASGERDANGTARIDFASAWSGDGARGGGRTSAPTETVPLHVELKAPSSVTVGEPLLRADDALDGAGLQSLVGSPDFVRRERPAAERSEAGDRAATANGAAGERAAGAATASGTAGGSATTSAAGEPAAGSAGERVSGERATSAAGERAAGERATGERAPANGATGERLAATSYATAQSRATAAERIAAAERAVAAEGERGGFDERGSFARRLENELSAAERRLFPNTPSTASGRAERYEDALGDIDLDALGIDTIPGIGADAFEGLEPRNGRPRSTSQATPE
ncbi:MAG TPA: hypothetical protein VIA18_03280, partial [Polyangia bacterium]|nr:hypothetical protein [Polyangia bacterium]